MGSHQQHQPFTLASPWKLHGILISPDRWLKKYYWVRVSHLDFFHWNFINLWAKCMKAYKDTRLWYHLSAVPTANFFYLVIVTWFQVCRQTFTMHSYRLIDFVDKITWFHPRSKSGHWLGCISISSGLHILHKMCHVEEISHHMPVERIHEQN